VTGNTVVLHRRSLPELVPGNKPTTHLIRPADVALPTGRVALLAVVFEGCGQRGTLFQVTSPGSKNGFKAAERRMEADIVCVGNVFMAGVAITLGRVGYQSHVGDFFISITAITTVTNNTADLTMGAQDEFSILQEDLLPYLQRR